MDCVHTPETQASSRLMAAGGLIQDLLCDAKRSDQTTDHATGSQCTREAAGQRLHVNFSV